MTEDHYRGSGAWIAYVADSPRRPPWSPSSGLLAACSASASSGDTLTWYINPDAGGQAKVAENCSTDDYTIETQVLPQDASQQRIQLARRLAAEDPEIDLMSLDPPFTAEFANAGFLAEIPQDLQDKLTRAVLRGRGRRRHLGGPAGRRAVLVQHPGALVPQVLRREGRHRHEPAGDLGPDHRGRRENGGKVAVQANKYEGYSVWINALISGAGGEIASETEKGADAHDRHRLARRRGRPAGIIEKLPRSAAAPADLSVSNEGTAGGTFGGDAGCVHGQLDLHLTNYDDDPARGEGRPRLHPLPRRPSRARSRGRRTAASASA